MDADLNRAKAAAVEAIEISVNRMKEDKTNSMIHNNLFALEESVRLLERIIRLIDRNKDKEGE